MNGSTITHSTVTLKELHAGNESTLCTELLRTGSMCPQGSNYTNKRGSSSRNNMKAMTLGA